MKPHLCKSPAREAELGVAAKLWDKLWDGERGFSWYSQPEEGVLLHTLLPDALGPPGLCGIKLMLLDLPVLQVVLWMVADLEPAAMIEQFVDNWPGVICGLGKGGGGEVGQWVLGSSCKGAADQFCLVVD